MSWNTPYCSYVYQQIIKLLIIIAAETPSSLPDNAELQEIIKKMYADNSDNLDEITVIKIPNQVSIGM